jgi:hypothetical protein
MDLDEWYRCNIRNEQRGQIMPFIEQEESFTDEIIEGKTVKVYKPRVEITLKNLEDRSRIYTRTAEAMTDVQNPNTATKPEHISRSVHVKVISLPLGALTNLG